MTKGMLDLHHDQTLTMFNSSASVGSDPDDVIHLNSNPEDNPDLDSFGYMDLMNQVSKILQYIIISANTIVST
jgi:hypothetical protein